MTPTNGNRGVAVVTGAAGGMGSAAASLLSAQGWPLVLCDLDMGRLEPLAARLRTAGPVEILAGDIAAPAYPDALIAALGDRQIGALIHTAGFSPTMADAARILEVNYDATVRLIEVARPRMADGGCAVLIASMAAHMVTSPEALAALNALAPGEGSATLRPFAPVSAEGLPDFETRSRSAGRTRSGRFRSAQCAHCLHLSGPHRHEHGTRRAGCKCSDGCSVGAHTARPHGPCRRDRIGCGFPLFAGRILYNRLRHKGGRRDARRAGTLIAFRL